MTAHSEGAGKGSEFTVVLPAARPDEVAAPSRAELVGGTEVALAPESRLRVLIVDDNVDAAEGLANLVKELGHEGRWLYDPLALKVAPSFRPQLCLLDVGLPVSDGYELAIRLRASGNLAPNARLVAVTGDGQDADRQRAMQAGFDEHLVKPVSLEVLAQALRATGLLRTDAV